MAKITSSCYMVLTTCTLQPVYASSPLCSLPNHPIHGPSASKVNRFVAGAQVFSFHCRTVVFHHLNVFYISECVLWPGVIVSPLSLPSYRELKRIKRGTCPRVCKIYVNFSTSVVNPLWTYIHTYKHNRRLRPHKCPHDYVPYTKVFSN